MAEPGVIVAAILAPLSVLAVVGFAIYCYCKNRCLTGYHGGSSQKLIGHQSTSVTGSFDCIETAPVCRPYFSAFMDLYLKDVKLVWHKKDQRIETKCPLIITSFTMSRVSDDLKSALEGLELAGNSVMLVVMQNCNKDSKPTRMATMDQINDYRITALVNVLIWNKVAYSCEINKKAAKEIKTFLSRKPQQSP